MNFFQGLEAQDYPISRKIIYFQSSDVQALVWRLHHQFKLYRFENQVVQ